MTTELVIEPITFPVSETCTHDASAERNAKFWARVTSQCESAPEEDRFAQWLGVGVCRCCFDPLRIDYHDENGIGWSLTDFLCSRCKVKETAE